MEVICFTSWFLPKLICIPPYVNDYDQIVEFLLSRDPTVENLQKPEETEMTFFQRRRDQ